MNVFVGTTGVADVMRSDDGGKSWNKTGLDVERLIHSLLINPFDSSVIYVGVNREGLHMSGNGGKSWKLVTNKFLADTTSVVELEMDVKNEVLYVATTYGDTGSLLKYDMPNNTWKELQAPISDQTFYYSKLKIYEFEGKVYTYFGLRSGIYARIDK